MGPASAGPISRTERCFSSLEAVDAPVLLERLELGRPHEAERRRGRDVRVAVRGGPRISVLLTLERRAPVHWLVLTTKRRCVALVFGMSNSRRISCGATGRGGSAGKASAGLVYTLWYPLSSEQSSPAGWPLLHAHTSNWRSAVKRLWPSSEERADLQAVDPHRVRPGEVDRHLLAVDREVAAGDRAVGGPVRAPRCRRSGCRGGRCRHRVRRRTLGRRRVVRR